MPLWTWLVPVLAFGALLVAWAAGVGPWLALLCGAALAGAVLVAVHHAEVVAHRLGEPFGTLVLALAVTAIETALILSMMVAGGQDIESTRWAYLCLVRRNSLVLFAEVLDEEFTRPLQAFLREHDGLGFSHRIAGHASSSALVLVLPGHATLGPCWKRERTSMEVSPQLVIEREPTRDPWLQIGCRWNIGFAVRGDPNHVPP